MDDLSWVGRPQLARNDSSTNFEYFDLIESVKANFMLQSFI